MQNSKFKIQNSKKRNPEYQDILDRTFEFSVRIVKLTKSLYDDPSVGRILARQVLRSGTSIGANIEEGQSAQSKPDFIHKFSIALKEARETRYWLRLLIASEMVEEHLLSELLNEADEITRVIAKIIVNTRKEN